MSRLGRFSGSRWSAAESSLDESAVGGSRRSRFDVLPPESNSESFPKKCRTEISTARRETASQLSERNDRTLVTSTSGLRDANLRQQQRVYHSLPTERQQPQKAEEDAENLSQNSTTLWMGDLDRWEDEEHLYPLFEEIAPQAVVRLKVVREPSTGYPLGYGFVELSSPEVAKYVLQVCKEMPRPGHGRKFKICWATGRRHSSSVSASAPSGGGSLAEALASGEPCIHVGGLLTSVTEEELRRVFEIRFRSLTSVRLAKDTGGESRGFGFVRFSDSAEFFDALRTMQDTPLHGKPIRVTVAQQQQKSSSQNSRELFKPIAPPPSAKPDLAAKAKAAVCAVVNRLKKTQFPEEDENKQAAFNRNNNAALCGVGGIDPLLNTATHRDLWSGWYSQHALPPSAGGSLPWAAWQAQHRAKTAAVAAEDSGARGAQLFPAGACNRNQMEGMLSTMASGGVSISKGTTADPTLIERNRLLQLSAAACSAPQQASGSSGGGGDLSAAAAAFAAAAEFRAEGAAVEAAARDEQVLEEDTSRAAAAYGLTTCRKTRAWSKKCRLELWSDDLNAKMESFFEPTSDSGGGFSMSALCSSVPYIIA